MRNDTHKAPTSYAGATLEGLFESDCGAGGVETRLATSRAVDHLSQLCRVGQGILLTHGTNRLSPHVAVSRKTEYLKRCWDGKPFSNL